MRNHVDQCDDSWALSAGIDDLRAEIDLTRWQLSTSIDLNAARLKFELVRVVAVMAILQMALLCALVLLLA